MNVPRYRLSGRTRAAAPVPLLDPAQRAVVEHRGGPLLVLAGPGTGKTTTLVEAVAARMTDPVSPLRPDQVLVLTFSRKAATELRDRIAARVGRTTSEPAAWTFHAFCYALLRSEQPAELYADPLRLLSGPEQDVVVRDLLRGSLESRRVDWPEALRVCLDTRGFTDEVRSVFSRARELGLEPQVLADVAAASGRTDWAAVAGFFGEYLEVLDAQGVLDYGELVHRAALLAEQPDVQQRLRERFAAVFVDEYQDTDPAQERLLHAIAGDGRDLVVVGDPDQSIYAFRGADVSGILEFPTRFPTAGRQDAPVLTLQHSRRAGSDLLAASRSLTGRMTIRSLDQQDVRAHRDLRPADGLPPGRIEVRTFPSAGAELEAVADTLRRAHLEDGVPWSSMAVVLRSGVRSIPVVRRVLGAAGVPVEVAADELPLAREPAVAPLLLALRCALDPADLTAERARSLLVSPLGGADASALRRLGRALRTQERLAAVQETGLSRLPRPSAELVRDALSDPGLLKPLDERTAAPARRLAALLADAAAVLEDGGSTEEALWLLWDGTPWPRRLERAAAEGGAGGQAADRDLDAVCALFDAAARAEERAGHRGARNLLEELEAQQIPGDTMAEQAARHEAVRLLTAHRSKGLEWDLVVVPAVQEGVWPDLRRRGSLLQADRLRRDGPTVGVGDVPSVAALLAEERRLFYVAVTRARRRLLVSAVASGDDDGERPSRFLGELGVEVEHRADRPSRPLSVTGLVAELRSAAVDPQSSPELRTAAARRLAMLASATDEAGRALVPVAHPRRWWGMSDLTEAEFPLRRDDAPVPLSGSSLSGLDTCALKWFLEHEARAESPRTTSLGFGSIVHALAAEVATGRLPAELGALVARLDQVWGEMAFEARWQSEQQREEAARALQRFLDWHNGRPDRTLLASEHTFEVQVETAAGPVVLRGSMDRVELDAEGRVHVIDFKTAKTPPSGPKVEQDPQLGAYQRAVHAGAVSDLLHDRVLSDDGLHSDDGVHPDDRPATAAVSGGAELVQLRKGTAKGLPKVQPQAALPSAGANWVDDLLSDAVRRLTTEDFAPTPNEGCERCPFRMSCPAQPEGLQVVS